MRGGHSLRRRYGRADSSGELDRLLDEAERRTSFGNDWRGEFKGVPLWVGEPGGSRVGQYEASVRIGDTGWNLRARTFAALRRKIKSVMATEGPR